MRGFRLVERHRVPQHATDLGISVRRSRHEANVAIREWFQATPQDAPSVQSAQGLRHLIKAAQNIRPVLAECRLRTGMILRYRRRNRRAADTRLVGAGINNRGTENHRLLSREHADGRIVNPAPTQDWSTPWQQTCTKYRAVDNFDCAIHRLSIARGGWPNLRHKQSFTIND